MPSPFSQKENDDQERGDFDIAQNFVMPLGKYKGQAIWQIACESEGLKYLDWLAGQDWVNGRLLTTLETYLEDPVIAKELDELLLDD